MNTVTSAEEAPGKTVGRRRRPRTMQDDARGGIAASRAWQRAGFAVRVPKGVFRFATHEEADRWLMDHLARNPAS